jgi:hypothetical protein
MAGSSPASHDPNKLAHLVEQLAYPQRVIGSIPILKKRRAFA